MDINTVKMKECGNDLVKLSFDLKELSDALYDRIKNMSADPDTGKCTGEWQGIAAKNFSKIVFFDKEQIMGVRNTLHLFGDLMVESAENYEARIKELTR